MFVIDFFKEAIFKFSNMSYVNPWIVKINWVTPNILKKSLKLRVVDAGDDESTMAELYALEGPNYSLEAYGISFTASPKHADWVMVVGAITHNMKSALKSAYDLTPNPKIIIACGDKAINWDKRFSEVVGWTKDVLGKVDLEIPGNPPSAKEIFSYLVSFISN